MSKRTKAVLAAGCGIVAVLWAAFNLLRAFAPEARITGYIAHPSNWLGVPEFVLLVVLVGLLRVNVSLAPLTARHGKAAERCRIAHFWVTIGCICITLVEGDAFRFWRPIDAGVYAPPPILAILEACLLPAQLVFASWALTTVSHGEACQTPTAPGAASPRVRPPIVRKAAAAIGSPIVRECVVTFLVAALLTGIWLHSNLPTGWGLDEWRRVVAPAAMALAFIAGIGSRNALAGFLSIVLGSIAGMGWALWTFPNDTGPPSIRYVILEVFSLFRWELANAAAGAATGAVLGTVARHLYLRSRRA